MYLLCGIKLFKKLNAKVNYNILIGLKVFISIILLH